MAEDLFGKLLDSSGVSAVYGRAIRQGDVAVIPTAEVISVMGFGTGFGYGPVTAEGEEAVTQTGVGEGGGGGGKTFSRPVAVVIASPEGVRVEPVCDRTKVLMTAITAGGFMAATLLRLMRPKRSLK